MHMNQRYIFTDQDVQNNKNHDLTHSHTHRLLGCEDSGVRDGSPIRVRQGVLSGVEEQG